MKNLFIFIFIGINLNAQTGVLSGRIVDESNLPLVGASLIIEKLSLLMLSIVPI